MVLLGPMKKTRLSPAPLSLFDCCELDAIASRNSDTTLSAKKALSHSAASRIGGKHGFAVEHVLGRAAVALNSVFLQWRYTPSASKEELRPLAVRCAKWFAQAYRDPRDTDDPRKRMLCCPQTGRSQPLPNATRSKLL